MPLYRKKLKNFVFLDLKRYKGNDCIDQADFLAKMRLFLISTILNKQNFIGKVFVS